MIDQMARFFNTNREAIFCNSFDNYYSKLGIYLTAVEQAQRQNTQDNG